MNEIPADMGPVALDDARLPAAFVALITEAQAAA